MSLSKAWVLYCLALLIFIALVYSLYKADLIWFSIIPYPLIGIILNRIILRNLVAYHPIYNTLSNVANIKLTAVLAWPSFYIVILVKLMIVKYL